MAHLCLIIQTPRTSVWLADLVGGQWTLAREMSQEMGQSDSRETAASDTLVRSDLPAYASARNVLNVPQMSMMTHAHERRKDWN
jgi:hypothetical protein